MKIAVTGANGKVGTALISELPYPEFEVVPLDLPGCDVTDFGQLVDATTGSDALIHLAWRGLNVNEVHPDNRKMYENAFRAAIANNIGLVIMGSSNHARSHDQREIDGRIRYTGQPEIPNNPYGAEKQAMEAMGKKFAAKGLAVVCLRIGNVNPENKPREDAPSRWLSYRDLGQLVQKALETDFEPGHFEVVYGVSQQETFDWANTFGYKPQDAS